MLREHLKDAFGLIGQRNTVKAPAFHALSRDFPYAFLEINF